MSKQISAAALHGDAGVALIHQRVIDMGFVWHPRGLDAGIDGEIELRDAITGVVANRVLFVQSKARTRFPGEDADGFHFLCDANDIAYWMQADVPVLLICSHPATREAWWAHVQAAFADPMRRANRRIDFDKRADRFDVSARQRLIDLADPKARALPVIAEHRPETLVSNLLPVLSVPSVVYTAPARQRTPRGVYAALREAGNGLVHDWALSGGHLLSFRHPNESGLVAACSGRIDIAQAATWADGDEAHQRIFVRLLNTTLYQITVADLESAGPTRLYFRASDDLSKRAIPGARGHQREVFDAKYGKNPGKVAYYRHAALHFQFVRIDGDWYVELVPTYYYTRDGYRESRYASNNLAGMKRLEKNLAVLGHVRMWARYLRGQDTLFTPERDDLLTFGELLTFPVERGIDDNAWRPTADPADSDQDHAGEPDALPLWDAS